MRLSDDIESRDISEAVELVRTAMQQSAIDPKSGKIDMDLINTGKPRTSAERIKTIADYIKKTLVSCFYSFAPKVMKSNPKSFIFLQSEHYKNVDA